MGVTVEVKFLEGDKFEVKTLHSEQTIYIDKKSENYTPQGPNPVELFLASLAGCVGIYSKRYLDNAQIKYQNLKISCKASFRENPLMLDNINLEIKTDAKLGDRSASFLRFVKNCPIHNTIVNTQEIEIRMY